MRIELDRLAKPNKTIREHTDELLFNALKLKKYDYIDEQIYNLLNEACEYHDYGKMNDEFQKRVKSERKIKFNPEKEVPHNILSLGFIDKNRFDKIEDYYLVCYAVLNHHQNVNNIEVFAKKKDLIDNFNAEFDLKKLKKRDMSEIALMKSNENAQILKGFLHKCDYSASGGYEIEYPNDFLDNSMKNLGYKWNELQKFCIENRDENIIVVANTGMGKTEAGLLWIGDEKGFFILPLRTAINAIYSRVIKNIVKEKIVERVSLLHSDVLSYYIKEAVTEEDKVFEYSQMGKKLNSPLTISTLDQIFDFVYLYHGFELKLSTLSYSKIVIDEIQAYSPDLLAYLVTGLEKVHRLGGKFAILTATLPPFVKDLIENKIGKIKFEKFVKGKDRHFVKVLNEKINATKIYDYYKENSGKVLVVCNTVKEAQNIYQELERLGIHENLNLLHAKFIRKDREKKEEDILKFGATENIGNGIWISTSLIEASLDIDFDCLFTELNDLNGFFQRLGRVNRKGCKSIAYPNAYLFSEIDKGLLINSPDSKKGFIDQKIYELSKKALEEFDGIMGEEKKVELIESFLTSDNLQNSNFMERYKRMKNYIDSLFVGEIDKNKMREMFRDIASYNVIPLSVYEDNKKEIEVHSETIKNPNETTINKAKAKNKIEQYCVSVGIYDLNKTGDKVDIGFDKIDIVNCEYSYEKGFTRIKTDDKKSEDSIDNFF